MSILEKLKDELVTLRRDIHKNPDLSNNENNTAVLIKNYISKYNPDEVIESIGGDGILFLFKGNESGKKIFIRAELDALPLKESSEVNYKSVKDHVAHLCGHDGHMAMVSGLAPLLDGDRIFAGTVGLLFQPAEETGEGANRVLNDDKFKEHMPDYIFALHNIPGAVKENVIVKNDVFAMASVGMIIKLEGKSTHAAYPEKGTSPGKSIAKIILGIDEVNSSSEYSGLAFATTIHSRLGDTAFGTQPGEGVLMLTLRAIADDDIEKLKQNIIKLADKVCASEGLRCEINYTEEFNATVNNRVAVDIIKKAASETRHTVEEIHKPFRWSEDFGRFTGEIKGAMFGLGAGGDQPELHNPDYDFPDDLIIEGTGIFYQIIKDLLYQQEIEDTTKHKQHRNI